MATLDKSTGENLGLDSVSDGVDRLITSIDHEGLVAAWNSANPTEVVSEGDRIISVNGLSGNSKKILKELQQPKAHQINFERGYVKLEQKRTETHLQMQSSKLYAALLTELFKEMNLFIEGGLLDMKKQLLVYH